MCITEYDEAETMRMLREEAREEGVSEGEDKLGQLIDILLASKRTDDARKAAVDKNVRKKLYKEFHIMPD